jgi:hypothetical protein
MNYRVIIIKIIIIIMPAYLWKYSYMRRAEPFGVRFLAGPRYFSILHTIHTGFGAHSSSYPMVPRALSAEVKRLERGADYLPSHGTEVNNGGAIPPLSLTSSWSDD